MRLIDADASPCAKCGSAYCITNCDKYWAWFHATVDAAPKWISVQDRLPDGFDVFYEGEDRYYEPAEYIVKVEGASIATIAMFDGKNWIPACYNGITEDRQFASPVTHWMPLPELPKEDEKQC